LAESVFDPSPTHVFRLELTRVNSERRNFAETEKIPRKPGQETVSTVELIVSPSQPTPAHSPSSAVLDLEAAAAYLGTSSRHLRRLYSERRIPFHKVGKYVRFSRADLDRFLAGHRVEAQ